MSGHLGFTGTANGLTNEQHIALRDLVDWLAPSLAHHGDCVGADASFHDVCVHVGGIGIYIHPPTNPRKRAWKSGAVTYPVKPYLDRNQDIVDASDLLIATPGEFIEQLRSGTWATVRRARKRHIPILFVFPDGTITREN